MPFRAPSFVSIETTYEHEKLIAAQAADDVLGSRDRLHASGDFDEYRIPRIVPVSVVDGLEAVQIQQQQCPMDPVPDDAGDGLFEMLRQETPIRQLCQWIDIGELPDLVKRRVPGAATKA